MGPTHKRTEGRAPVWGSEFTPKDAALQGGVSEIAATGWTRSKQEQLCLTVTRAFHRIKELSSDVCPEKAKWMLGFASRCLFGRLARAMTKNVLYIRAIRI